MARYRVSADIGGTFTDFVVEDEVNGESYTGKIPSTPDNPALAVLRGLRELIPEPGEIDFMVHGTTVGLNAFLERKGARVLLIMTAGMRDAYTIARGDRQELYTLKYHKPARLVPRRDVHEVRGRLKWDGTVIEPLCVEDFEPIIRKVKAENVAAVAVCFLHSFAYPEHELEAREILSEALPDVSITLSHEIAREWREYERASTAVMNAYIAPTVERYLVSLEQEIRTLGVSSRLHVMQSSGGVMTLENARELPVQTLLSGPVGGVIGGAELSTTTGRSNLICVDMGGTSFDMSLITDGRPEVTSETYLEGLPLLMTLGEIHTIGAGGGSIARLEAGGLRVGPHSAGADPGPACYGRGGTEPTVTDANLYLGRLGPSSLLKGRLELDENAAAAAIRNVASQLKMDDVALAEGILSIVNAKMADGIRTITVGQGIDPRDYTLIAFGGAGPMHAVRLAEELEFGEVIVPHNPGTFSAWGMLQADLRHDLARTFYRELEGLSPTAVDRVIQELTEAGRDALRQDNVGPEAMAFDLSCDMRYVGQEYTVNVRITPEIQLEEIERAFHNAYHSRYGHATPGAPVEFVNVRVTALGRICRRPFVYTPVYDELDPVVGSRRVIFNGDARETPVLHRERFAPGQEWRGPAIIEEDTSITVVPPGYQVRVDDHGNLVMTRTARSESR